MMNTQLLSVTSCHGAMGKRAKIAMCGSWLPQMGFEQDSLVQVIPVQNGMDFILRDINISKYSDLSKDTKKKNGKLIQVFSSKGKDSVLPNLVTTGDYIGNGGLSIGDLCVVRYEYGNIQMRKLDLSALGFTDTENIRVLPSGTVTEKYTGNAIAKVRITGDWLCDYGFECDSLVSVSAEQNTLVFDLQDEGIQKYSQLVKTAREKKMKLMQVRTEGGLLHLGLTGSMLERAGFSLNDVFIANCKYGQIIVQRLDLKQLGF